MKVIIKKKSGKTRQFSIRNDAVKSIEAVYLGRGWTRKPGMYLKIRLKSGEFLLAKEVNL